MPAWPSVRSAAAARTAKNFLGPTHATHAADFLIAEAAARPGELVVVAIGPMTNLALAIERDPLFARNVRELVLMAGSATTSTWSTMSATW